MTSFNLKITENDEVISTNHAKACNLQVYVGIQFKKQDHATSHPKAHKDNEAALDPVYKKLSAINGEINRMNREELQSRLAELKLNTRGVNDVLKKRLKSYYRQRKLMKAKVKPPGDAIYDYILVIDFEATCDENSPGYQHEIIEFPVILVDAHEKKIIDEFHSFCKPTLNPVLTKFCSKLTGITQEKVDEAEFFPDVLKRMELWMQSLHLGQGHSFAILTDGPWDMSRFLSLQCDISKIPYPKWAKKWINIRKTYSNYYQCKRLKLEVMLSSLGMTFEGTLHCGLHDSRNIARIAIKLMEDGCVLKVNEFIERPKNLGRSSDDGLEEPEQSCDRGIDQSMKSLSLNDKESDEDDSAEDLLEYYRLQKN
ncbi:hypothetical protein FSP39_022478 [Pinctada imbricata]|uniref:3'-5' exoribonuclease 1 n=1 Tax=Pinctada imbricata TaxID=66713 RepID=A0AA89C5Z6_PINIB|nr:hypothetical protein FSP39_022478 [Pinctada imbricata]